MGTNIESFRRIISNRKQKSISKYINLECQNEQFDVLIQKLHEIADSKVFENLKTPGNTSLASEITNLIAQQKDIQTKISKMKNEIKNPNINIMN